MNSTLPDVGLAFRDTSTEIGNDEIALAAAKTGFSETVTKIVEIQSANANTLRAAASVRPEKT